MSPLRLLDRLDAKIYLFVIMVGAHFVYLLRSSEDHSMSDERGGLSMGMDLHGLQTFRQLRRDDELGGVDPPGLRSRRVRHLHPTFLALYNVEFGAFRHNTECSR